MCGVLSGGRHAESGNSIYGQSVMTGVCYPANPTRVYVYCTRVCVCVHCRTSRFYPNMYWASFLRFSVRHFGTNGFLFIEGMSSGGL